MYLIDTTLRDGEQSPDVFFSLSQKLQIAESLYKFGIREIEIRTPVGDTSLAMDTKVLLGSEIAADWLVWCRCKEEDLDTAEEAGATRVHLAYPVSDLQLATLGKEWDTAQEWLHLFYRRAVSRFEFVSVGAQDASRTPYERLKSLFRIAQQAGVQRVRIADTLGVMTPSKVCHLFTKLKNDFPHLPMEFHGHNDLGFATANALAALESGADAASATILGLGERCGNASLEQLAFALCQQKHNSFHHYALEQIMAMCELVANAAKSSIPDGQPLVGRNAVRHQSGIHVAGMLKDERSYQPFDPRLVGRRGPELELGPLSGRALLRGKGLNPVQLQALWQKIRRDLQGKTLGYSG